MINSALSTQHSALRIGTMPINWNNRDLAGWRPEIDYPVVLDEMAVAGYEGTELGHNFPTEPRLLAEELEHRGLALTAAYHWLDLADATRFEAEAAAAVELARFLAMMDCSTIVLAVRGDAHRQAIAGRVGPADGLSDEGWRRLAEGVMEVARRCAALGVHAAYHNHAGTYVETQDEVARLCALTDPTVVGLCLDTGHLVYGGGDPVAVCRAHGARLRYVHLKDVDAAVLRRSRTEGLSFVEALRAYIFCELGRGLVDVPGVVSALRAAGYAGWLVVEQDTTPRPSLDSARESREYLRNAAGL